MVHDIHGREPFVDVGLQHAADELLGYDGDVVPVRGVKGQVAGHDPVKQLFLVVRLSARGRN